MADTNRVGYTSFLCALALLASAADAQLPTPTLSSQVLPGTTVGYDYGTAVAISGTTLVVGAPVEGFRPGATGAAYVYEFRRGTWTGVATLAPPELLAGDQFGASVSIDGDTIVVGAPGDDTVRDPSGAVTQTVSNKGAAYVFRRTASGWTQEARLDQLGVNGLSPSPRVPAVDDAFGTSVAISSAAVLVGVPGADRALTPGNGDSGAVNAYRRDATGWHVDGEIVASAFGRPIRGLRLGASLALTEHRAVALADPSITWPAYELRRRPQTTGDEWVFGAPLPTGFTSEFSSRDGAGFNANFSNITSLIPNATGVQVVEASLLRLVTTSGVVTTLRALPIATHRTFETQTTFLSAVNGKQLFRGDLDGAYAFLAGNPTLGLLDGTGAAAGFGMIQSVSGDGQGGYYVSDLNAIRHVTPGGVVTTVAGIPGVAGDIDGPAGSGLLRDPRAIVFDPATQTLFIADGTRIRRMATDGTLDTLVGSTTSTASADGPAATATFLAPRLLALASDGALRVIDGNALRRVTLAGDVQTLSGSAVDGGRPVDGPAAVARFATPYLLAPAPDGSVYVADGGVVRRVAVDGTVTTLAGRPVDPVNLNLPQSAPSSVVLRAGQAAVGITTGDAPLRPTGEGAGVVWVSSEVNGAAAAPYPAFAPDGARAFGAAVAFSGEWLFVSDVGDGGLSIYGRPVTALRFTGDRWMPAFLLGDPNAPSSSVHGAALAGSDRFLVVGAPSPPLKAASGGVIVYDLDTLDSDGDGLPDRWEQRYGLDPAVTTGTDGADGDPDGDGATNAAEFAVQTHPRNVASATRYFAEGARTSFFATEFAIANAGPTAANVLLRYAAPDGTVASTPVTVPARQRRTVTVPIGEVREFATRVESDAPAVVDRVMTWDVDRGYGSHGEHALEAPATTWYFAEGATHSGFDLFYLLYNPSTTTPAHVRVRYLRAAGAPLEKTYEVGPNQRFNILVNLEEFAGARLLAAADVSARLEVDNAVPIIAERAMYRTVPGAAPGTAGVVFGAGHESAGITAPSASWLFAEGATNDFFDLFVLVANPGDQPSTVRARYLLASGETFVKDYVIAPASRFTIWVDQETFAGHAGMPLANVGAVSTTLEVLSGPAVVAERAMWWPGPTPATWVEAHNSPGATITAARWIAAAGEATSGVGGADTYYLIANPGDAPAAVTVTLLLDDGTAEIAKVYDVGARSRFSVDVRSEFPAAVGKRFSAVVTTAPTTPVVVEWALYRDALGQFWGAGANALATPVP